LKRGYNKEIGLKNNLEIVPNRLGIDINIVLGFICITNSTYRNKIPHTEQQACFKGI
jgi:hypothetical protein